MFYLLTYYLLTYLLLVWRLLAIVNQIFDPVMLSVMFDNDYVDSD